MQKLFNNEFYNRAESRKPIFEDNLDLDMYAENDGGEFGEANGNDYSYQEQNCEDGDFNMDCDFTPEKAALAKQLKLEARMRRKSKRKLISFVETISNKEVERPVYNEKLHKTFQNYLDEYYSLDCEDFIDDLPCRFKYKQVIPNSFGLTIEEILAADDKELENWSALKKINTLRSDQQEKYDVKAYKLKAKNEKLKKKILPSLYRSEDTSTEGEANNQTPKKKKKKKKKKGTSTDNNKNPQMTDNGVKPEPEDGEIKHNKRKHATKEVKDISASGTNACDDVKNNSVVADECNLNESVHLNGESSKSRKKKKKKETHTNNNEILQMTDNGINPEDAEMKHNKRKHATKEVKDISSSSTKACDEDVKNNSVVADQCNFNKIGHLNGESSKMRKKKKKKETHTDDNEILQVTDNRINTMDAKMKHNKRKHGTKEVKDISSSSTKACDEEPEKKKKKVIENADEGVKTNSVVASESKLNESRHLNGESLKKNKKKKKKKKKEKSKKVNENGHVLNGNINKKKLDKVWSRKSNSGKTKTSENVVKTIYNDISNERLIAYGINPKLFRRKLKYDNFNE